MGDPVCDINYWNDTDVVPVHELRDERIDHVWIVGLDEYVATVIQIREERIDRESLFGRPLSERLEQRILIVEILIVRETSGADLILDYVLHLLPLRKALTASSWTQSRRTLLDRGLRTS